MCRRYSLFFGGGGTCCLFCGPVILVCLVLRCCVLSCVVNVVGLRSVASNCVMVVVVVVSC